MTTLPRPTLSPEVRERLVRSSKANGKASSPLAIPTANPSVEKGQYSSWPMAVGEDFGRRANSVRRYYAVVDDGEWPPELADYNKRFAQTLDKIKRRHDSVVTTVGKFKLD